MGPWPAHMPRSRYARISEEDWLIVEYFAISLTHGHLAMTVFPSKCRRMFLQILPNKRRPRKGSAIYICAHVLGLLLMLCVHVHVDLTRHHP